MANGRSKRVAEELKKIVSQMMLMDIKDPRISKLSSVNHVDVTNDFRFATFYVSSFDPQHDIEETIAGLNSAKGYIRKEMGKKIKLHYTPEPIFKADHSVEHGMHINEVLGKINQENAEKKVNENENEDEDDQE